jgi:hypothetical protein
MLYPSVKMLGAFSDWLADMKVGHAGRSPSFLIAKVETLSKHLEGMEKRCSLTP